MIDTMRLLPATGQFWKIVAMQLSIACVLLATTGSKSNAQSVDPTLENSQLQAELPDKALVTRRAQDASTIDFTEMAEQQVLVTDATGKPVAGAAVMPFAMRVIEVGGHGFWNETLLGRPKTAVSDQQGLATIRYPRRIGGSPDVWTTRSVTFEVRHPEFVEQVVHFELGSKRAEVTLEAGCEVQLSAVDEHGKPITDFGVLMSGRFASDQWTSDGSGGKRTRAIKDGKWQTMLVKLDADGPTLFSSVLPLPVRPGQVVKIRNVQLSPGARISGRLSHEVPRPVKHGRIISVVVPKPAASSYAPADPSLVWYECADINEAGEFELPSVPRGGEVQIIAICDGWVSTTTMEGANNFFVMGQLFDVKADRISVSVAMERTGSLEVIAVKPDGSPLAGASISTAPNQLYYKGGSTYLGQQMHSRVIIANQSLLAEQQARPYDRDAIEDFSAITAADGKATIHGIPIGRRQSLSLNHPDYCLPKKEGERMQRYMIASPKVEHLRIVVEQVSR